MQVWEGPGEMERFKVEKVFEGYDDFTEWWQLESLSAFKSVLHTQISDVLFDFQQ